MHAAPRLWAAGLLFVACVGVLTPQAQAGPGPAHVPQARAPQVPQAVSPQAHTAPTSTALVFSGTFSEPKMVQGRREVQTVSLEVFEARPTGRSRTYNGFRGFVRITEASRTVEYEVVNAYLTLGTNVYLARHQQSALTVIINGTSSPQAAVPAQGKLLYDDHSFAREVKGSWQPRVQPRQRP